MSRLGIPSRPWRRCTGSCPLGLFALTHAATVTADLGSRVGSSGTRTLAVLPSKLSAEPKKPGDQRAGPMIAPLLASPETSCATWPPFSSSGHHPPSFGAASACVADTSASASALSSAAVFIEPPTHPAPLPVDCRSYPNGPEAHVLPRVITAAALTRVALYGLHATARRPITPRLSRSNWNDVGVMTKHRRHSGVVMETRQELEEARPISRTTPH